MQWAVENFYLGPACEAHCGGHGDCLDQRCLCDPGFTGPNCYASSALKVNHNKPFMFRSPSPRGISGLCVIHMANNQSFHVHIDASSSLFICILPLLL